MGLGLILEMTGCVGIGNIVSEEKNVQFNPALKEGTISSSIKPKHFTKEDLTSLWGEPSQQIVADDGREGWVYNNRMAWGGAIVWVIIPVPLVAPIGYRSTTVYFDNNMTNDALYEYSRTPTKMCSLIPIMWLVHGSTNSWCHEFKDL